jgi:hypothetical protein
LTSPYYENESAVNHNNAAIIKPQPAEQVFLGRVIPHEFVFARAVLVQCGLASDKHTVCPQGKDQTRFEGSSVLGLLGHAPVLRKQEQIIDSGCLISSKVNHTAVLERVDQEEKVFWADLPVPV